MEDAATAPLLRCRGLKRLEGELNTIRLQTNSQPSLQIDDRMLPQEFCLHTGSIPRRLLKEMMEHLPVGLKGEFLQAMINTQPNTRLVRDALLRGETVRSGRCSSISFNKPCGMLPVCRQNSWGNSRRDQNGCASNATSSLEAIAISAVCALYGLRFRC